MGVAVGVTVGVAVDRPSYNNVGVTTVHPTTFVGLTAVVMSLYVFVVLTVPRLLKSRISGPLARPINSEHG